MESSSQQPDPNVRFDHGGWLSGPCLPVPALDDVPHLPPATPLRVFQRAVLDALTLPAPASSPDEIVRFRLLGERAKIVAAACRRLLAGTEADSADLLMAAGVITDLCAGYPADSYDWHPLGS